MFQFSTTTVINKASSYDKWTTASGTLKGFIAKFGPTFKTTDNTVIYKTAPIEEVNDEIVLDLSGLDTDTIYRLNIYVRSTGNADPMYANDFVFKGKPFYVEFKGDQVSKIKDIAERYMLALYDVKQLDFSLSGTTLTIKGTNGYQRLFKVALEKWADSDYVTLFNNDLDDDGKIVSNKVTSIKVGCEGYGTYEQVLKDLRLPTSENLGYTSVNRYDMPVAGATYYQYTVKLTKDLTNYPGGVGINNPTQSVTYHNFFVNANVQSDFETKLKEGLSKTISTDKTVATNGVNRTITAHSVETEAGE